MLSAIILRKCHYAKSCYAECRYARRHQADCSDTRELLFSNMDLNENKRIKERIKNLSRQENFGAQ